MSAFRDVVNSGVDFGRQVVLHTVFDGIVDVTVRFVAEELPYGGGIRGCRGFKCDFAVLSSRIQKEGNDGIFANVFGDVLFGVVGAHLFLVDVFFKYVAEDIGVDFVIVAQRTVVEVPSVALEEREEPFKGGVGNLNPFADDVPQFGVFGRCRR